MKLNPFEMERWQATWENRVRFNLSESGVHPMTVTELLALAETDPAEVLGQRLRYSQSNGTEELRALIARSYTGAQPDEILVTTGGTEANYVATWSLLEPGDPVVMQVPNYMQMWGLAEAFAGEARSFRLVEERGWAPDLDQLADRSRSGVKAIIVTNPNNPTGAILTTSEIDEIVRIAEPAGAWIIADEIYIGSELDGTPTPSFWGRYDKLLITSGLSKAYGLPGLRIGWIAGPTDSLRRLWSYKDYTSIAPSTLSDVCACLALEPKTRERIRERTRGILNENLPTLTEWLSSRSDIFQFLAPRAGAICYTRYNLEIGSSELARRLKDDQDVLVVPGDHFCMDGYLRIGYGLPRPDLLGALDRIEQTIRRIGSVTLR